MAYSYVVRMAIDDARVFASWIAWLRDRHLGDVVAAGAEHAELVIEDVAEGAPLVVEARYRFSSREAYARYELDEAPRLRAEGLRVLADLGASPGNGVMFARTTGEIQSITPRRG